jgi:hypothetical protein
MDKLPKMDCKGRKLIFYCKSFLGNMLVVFWEKEKQIKTTFFKNNFVNVKSVQKLFSKKVSLSS